ncbi:MAG: GNAT family N-acetyltransferase, partial [bacterium]|nr:GNAT family N-acetyltransferase [bacterium]
RMMDFALQRAQEAGCYKLALSTNVKRDEAHRFYENLGYKRHGYSYLIEIDYPEE